MIALEIVTFCESGDIQTLANVEWPAIPRVGDRIQLHGDAFGDGYNDHSDMTEFVVVNVYWKQKMLTLLKRGADDVEISVLVALPPEETVFVVNCTCDETQICLEPGNVNRCGFCGNRITGKHHRKFGDKLRVMDTGSGGFRG